MEIFEGVPVSVQKGRFRTVWKSEHARYKETCIVSGSFSGGFYIEMTDMTLLRRR